MQRFLTLMPIALLVAVGLAACAAGNDNGGFFDTATTVTGQSAGGFGAEQSARDQADFAFGDDAVFEEIEAQGAEQAAEQAESFPAGAPTAEPLPSTGGGLAGPDDRGGDDGALQIVERRVISTGFLRIEVEAVRAAVDQIQLTAEALGGFVENSSVSGDDEEAFAEITIRVPQDEFLNALARIRRLGEVRDENLGAQDVTEQFIDLEARLRASLREEESLLNLLERATDVDDVLIIERELSRIRSDIERVQGQLNFLERRVSLATLSISLFTPFSVRTEPPSAAFGIETGDVEAAIAAIEEIAASVDGLVDASVITISEGEASGFVAIRVPRDDFDRTVAAVAALGDVQTKTVRTGEGSDDPEAAISDEPDAPVEVRLREKDDGTSAGLIAGIVVASVLGGLLLLGVAFRLGRGR